MLFFILEQTLNYNNDKSCNSNLEQIVNRNKNRNRNFLN